MQRVVSKRRALCALLAIGLVGCGSGSTLPDVVLDRVDPAMGPPGESVSVRIEGTGFLLPLDVDLDENAVTIGDMDVSVGGVSFVDAVLQSEQLIDAVVPGTLAAGAHDVVVVFSDGRQATLTDGYLVVCAGGTCGDGICCAGDNEDPCSCAADCGASTCGDGICCTAESEDPCGCAADCGAPECGDGDCCIAAGETATNCAADCAVGGCGACTGVCADSCGSSCSLSCNGGACTCNFDCANVSDECRVDCDSNSTCVVDCQNTNDCDIRCEGGSTCDITCNGSDCGEIRCQGGAMCLVDCTGANSCAFKDCDGGSNSCPGNIIVCNRACP